MGIATIALYYAGFYLSFLSLNSRTCEVPRPCAWSLAPWATNLAAVAEKFHCQVCLRCRSGATDHFRYLGTLDVGWGHANIQKSKAEISFSLQKKIKYWHHFGIDHFKHQLKYALLQFTNHPWTWFTTPHDVDHADLDTIKQRCAKVEEFTQQKPWFSTWNQPGHDDCSLGHACGSARSSLCTWGTLMGFTNLLFTCRWFTDVFSKCGSEIVGKKS